MAEGGSKLVLAAPLSVRQLDTSSIATRDSEHRYGQQGHVRDRLRAQKAWLARLPPAVEFRAWRAHETSLNGISRPDWARSRSRPLVPLRSRTVAPHRPHKARPSPKASQQHPNLPGGATHRQRRPRRPVLAPAPIGAGDAEQRSLTPASNVAGQSREQSGKPRLLGPESAPDVACTP